MTVGSTPAQDMCLWLSDIHHHHHCRDEQFMYPTTIDSAKAFWPYDWIWDPVVPYPLCEHWPQTKRGCNHKAFGQLLTHAWQIFPAEWYKCRAWEGLMYNVLACFEYLSIWHRCHLHLRVHHYYMMSLCTCIECSAPVWKLMFFLEPNINIPGLWGSVLCRKCASSLECMWSRECSSFLSSSFKNGSCECTNPYRDNLCEHHSDVSKATDHRHSSN